MSFSLSSIPFYNAQDPPVILLTGGTSGIGTITTRELARHGARVYVTVRSQAKANDLLNSVAEIKNSEKGYEDIVCDVRIIKCDLMDLTSVKQAAQEFQSKEPKLEYAHLKHSTYTLIKVN